MAIMCIEHEFASQMSYEEIIDEVLRRCKYTRMIMRIGTAHNVSNKIS